MKKGDRILEQTIFTGSKNVLTLRRKNYMCIWKIGLFCKSIGSSNKPDEQCRIRAEQ